MNFNALVRCADAYRIQYHIVKPPMRFIPLAGSSDNPYFNFQTGNINNPYLEFTLDPVIKLGAFRERVRKVISREILTVWYKEKAWSLFAATFDAANPNKKLMVLATAGPEKRALGLMTHYNYVTHGRLLQGIKEAGLADVTEGYFTSHDMTCRIRLNTTKQGCAFLNITNGFTGTKSLTYSFGVRLGSELHKKPYEFIEPLQFGRKRHLSHVMELVKVIGNAVETVRDMKILDNLEKMSFETAFNVMVVGCGESTKRKDVLVERLKECYPMKTGLTSIGLNSLDLVNFLSGFRGVRGYAKSVDSLVDPIVHFALTY